MATIPEENLWLDETVDTDRAADYHLLLSPSPRGLLILLLERQRNMLVGCAYEPATIRDLDPWGAPLARACERWPWVKAQFAGVTLAYAGATCTTLPTYLYDPSAAKALLEAVCGPIERTATIVSAPTSPDSTLLFTMPGDMVHTYASQFPNREYRHPWSSLAHCLTSAPRRKPTLVVVLYPDHAAYVAIQGETLLSLVSKPLPESQALLYQVAALHDAYQWEPRETLLHILTAADAPELFKRKRKAKTRRAPQRDAGPTPGDCIQLLAPYFPRIQPLQLSGLQCAYHLEPLLQQYTALLTCFEY